MFAGGHRRWRQKIGEGERVADRLHNLELGPGERPGRTKDDDGPATIALLCHQEGTSGRSEAAVGRTSPLIAEAACMTWRTTLTELPAGDRSADFPLGSPGDCTFPPGPTEHDSFVEHQASSALRAPAAWASGLGACACRRQARPKKPLRLELDLHSRCTTLWHDLAQHHRLSAPRHPRSRQPAANLPERQKVGRSGDRSVPSVALRYEDDPSQTTGSFGENPAFVNLVRWLFTPHRA